MVEPLRYMAEELGYGLVVKGKKRQESVRSSVAPKRDEESFVPSLQAADSRRTVEQ